MANEENLIPNSERSPSERRELARKAGKASGKARRRKKSMKQAMEMLLNMPANTSADWNMLVEMGIDTSELSEEDVTNLLIVNATLLKQAKEGDVASVKELRSIIQDDLYQKEKLKIEKEKLKLEKQKLEPVMPDEKPYTGIPANMVAPSFSSVLFDIENKEHTEYVFPGGRGSTKSSFVGLQVVDLIKKNKNIHACVLRQVADTLRSSVYQQILWATIDGLGNIGQGKYTKSTKTDSKSVANSGGSGIIKSENDIDEKQARFLYDKMSRNQRIEVIQKGQSVEKPIFSYDREDNKAMAYLQKVPKQENAFDIMTHGSPNSVEFFKQDYPQGDIRSKIDAYTLSLIMRNREDYTRFIAECKEKGVTPIVRLLSCSTGDTTNTGNCFAQLLANELKVKVVAPTDTLFVNPNGTFYIGIKKDGKMKIFYARK